MARSNNNNKLKAFVRFDGSGRIIPSSLIVQAFKPKVGNWKEIDAKECCNYVAPTTTTSTTVAPTTTTTTTVEPLDLNVTAFCDLEPNDHGYTGTASGGVPFLVGQFNTPSYEYSTSYYETDQEALAATQFFLAGEPFLGYLNPQDFGKTLWVSVRDAEGTMVAASWTDTCQEPTTTTTTTIV
jgi:hypothetical protein